MPIAPTYPGVYVEEIPSGVHTIVGVATSITAFVGRTPGGPVNEPTTIHGTADFDRIFGGLGIGYALPDAVQDFFQDGGGEADVDRGVVNIRVGFAPLKPAEFVVIQLQQIAGQAQP